MPPHPDPQNHQHLSTGAAGRPIVTSALTNAFKWRDLVRAYWQLLGDMRWRWLGLMATLAALNVYSLVPPLIIGKIVDAFTTQAPAVAATTFKLYALALGGSFALAAFLRLTTKNKIGNIQTEVIYQTKVRGFEKLLEFSLAWHLEEGAGSKSQVITTGIAAYRDLNKGLNNEIIRTIISFAGIAVVFAFLRPLYVLFFVIYALGFYAILQFSYRFIRAENDAYVRSMELASGSYTEGLSNILTIKTFGADADFKQHVASREGVTREHEYVIRRLYNKLWRRFQTFNGLCYGVFLYMTGADVLAGHITPGSLVIFYGYLQNLIGNASDMLETYEVALSAKASIGRMMSSIFWLASPVTSGDKILPSDWRAIEIRNARLDYTKSTHSALTDLTLTIPRGANIGVVGRTGSGKSTLAKLLSGLYQISAGSYEIGGTSFYDLTHDQQHAQIALVLQETEIFNMNLRDNITLMRSVAPELLAQAISISQLDDVIAKLPQGLDSLVGEKGYQLSGGERQRVGIARAICKNAPIMIFDEATSSLDTKTERLIQQGLETAFVAPSGASVTEGVGSNGGRKTLISIAHRVSTLEKTDTIYVFDAGRIVEQGSYAELSARADSKFSELYRRQGGAADNS